jgi:alkylhydroperoxidase family enzyme
MLLNSPSFSLGWNTHLGAVRKGLAVPAKLRELAICGVAVLNAAEYELQQHLPEFRQAGGTEAQAAALRSFEAASRDTSLFDAAERAVMQLTIEMTRNVQVSDGTFEQVREALADSQQVVEMVGIVATYNMVSRFLVALGIELEAV